MIDIWNGYISSRSGDICAKYTRIPEKLGKIRIILLWESGISIFENDLFFT